MFACHCISQDLGSAFPFCRGERDHVSVLTKRGAEMYAAEIEPHRRGHYMYTVQSITNGRRYRGRLRARLIDVAGFSSLFEKVLYAFPAE